MKPKSPDAFIKSLPPEIRAVLLYGPDSGLARERAGTLGLKIVDDLSDPFNVAELSVAQLRDEPARLLDEMAAQSLLGGRRLVRIREAEDAVVVALKNMFESLPPGDSFLVVEAGDLRPTSPLRKLFEGADIAAALPCYEADARDLVRLAQEEFKVHGITATQDALALLANSIASDRGVARQEIEKLITYAGTGGKLNFDDIAVAIGDSAVMDLDDPAWLTADGNVIALERSLQRLFGDGMAPVAILRAAQRHFTRLYEVVASADPVPIAIDSLKPPVFWKDKERLSTQASRWRRGQLEKVLVRLHKAELECKTSALRDVTMCSRALAAIAGVAATRR